MIKIQDTLKGQENLYPTSYYIQNKYPPQSSPNTLSFSTSQQVINFEIPSGVWNPSKTHLNFTLSAALIQAGANNYYSVPQSFMPFIKRIELFNSSGVQLISLSNADKYTKSNPLNFSHQNNYSFNGSNIQSSRTTLTNGDITCDTYFDFTLNGSTPVYGNIPVETLDAISNNFFSLINGLLNKQYSIELGKIYFDTFFSINKDIYLARPLYLRLTISTLQECIRVCNANGVNQNYPANFSPTMSNIELVIYSQGNELLANTLKMENSYLIMPYVWNNTSTLIGSTQTINFSLTPISTNPLCRLYKTYYYLFMPNVDNVLNNSSNLLSYTTSKLYTQCIIQLNGKQLKTLDCNVSDEDLTDINNQFNHSFRNRGDYKYNGCIANVFNSDKSVSKYDSQSIMGIPFNNNNSISLNHQFSVPAAMVVPLQHHLFAVALIPLFYNQGEFSYQPFSN